jgi:predicted small metal-binding protein
MSDLQRKTIDCRNFPSEKNCTLAISGTEEEVLETAVYHAVTVHGHAAAPELREQLRSMLKDEAEAKTARV